MSRFLVECDSGTLKQVYSIEFTTGGDNPGVRVEVCLRSEACETLERLREASFLRVRPTCMNGKPLGVTLFQAVHRGQLSERVRFCGDDDSFVFAELFFPSAFPLHVEE